MSNFLSLKNKVFPYRYLKFIGCNIYVMAKYAMFLELSGKKAVVVGNGAMAIYNAQILLESNARLVVVAENMDKIMIALCKNKNAEVIWSKYEKRYLIGSVLAIAATNDPELNKQVHKDCQELEILCNVIDDP